MNAEIKKYADSGNLKALKYIFVDSLDADPTFVHYEEDYNYCRSIPGLLEEYVELTPFRENTALWDEDYWISLKQDLVKNFSDKRMKHMRTVAKVFMADKVKRILAEREKQNVELNRLKEPIHPKIEQHFDKVQTQTQNPVHQSAMSGREAQQREIAEAQRELEAHNRRVAAEQAAKDAAKRKNMYEPRRQTIPTGGGLPKKAIGIAVAAAAAVIIWLLLK